MKPTDWVHVAMSISKGNSTTCPVCGKGVINHEYKKIGDDYTLFLKCPACKEMAHFSHIHKP